MQGECEEIWGVYPTMDRTREPALSRVTQKAQFDTQTIYLIEQIEHRFEPIQIDAVNGPEVLDPPNGMDRLFREFHYPVWPLKYGLYKASATINQNGATGGTREMCRRIEAVENVWLRLK
jgi:hypothetical protein